MFLSPFVQVKRLLASAGSGSIRLVSRKMGQKMGQNDRRSSVRGLHRLDPTSSEIEDARAVATISAASASDTSGKSPG